VRVRITPLASRYVVGRRRPIYVWTTTAGGDWAKLQAGLSPPGDIHFGPVGNQRRPRVLIADGLRHDPLLDGGSDFILIIGRRLFPRPRVIASWTGPGAMSLG
jgi:hypothetical protein